MDTKLVNEVTSEYTKTKHPKFNVGDIIEVHTKLKEGGKERIQVFKGIVVSIKGSGVSKTFTVRKISYGIGVEKIMPLHSPKIAKIKVVKSASKVKRSKLYFLRERVGKDALKAGIQIPAVGEDLETKFEEEVKKPPAQAGEQQDQPETDTDKSGTDEATEVGEGEKEDEKKKEQEDGNTKEDKVQSGTNESAEDVKEKSEETKEVKEKENKEKKEKPSDEEKTDK